MKQRILEILAELVACDTQNPPRAIESQGQIFQFIRATLGDDFAYQTIDHGRGRVTLLARVGNPRILFNVHLDTVPVGDGWTRPALGGRA